MREVAKIYLDACCLNRLTDDQSQPRIRREAEAVEQVFRSVRSGLAQWVSSVTLAEEIQRNPDIERRRAVQTLLPLAHSVAPLGPAVIRRALELEEVGFGAFDALHLSCAEDAKVNVFLTTDDSLLRRAAREAGSLRVRVVNPVSWMLERQDDPVAGDE